MVSLLTKGYPLIGAANERLYQDGLVWCPMVGQVAGLVALEEKSRCQKDLQVELSTKPLLRLL